MKHYCFFKCLADRTLALKSDKCIKSKNRRVWVNALVVQPICLVPKHSITGFRENRKPRCFSHVEGFPLNYTSNIKSWMTATDGPGDNSEFKKKLQKTNNENYLIEVG